MNIRTSVFVYADDPVSQAGLEQLLRSRAGVHVLGSGQIDEAEVAVVGADEVDDDTVRAIAGVQRNGCPRVVVVATRLDEAACWRRARPEPSGMLRRREATPEQLGRVVAAGRRRRGERADRPRRPAARRGAPAPRAGVASTPCAGAGDADDARAGGHPAARRRARHRRDRVDAVLLGAHREGRHPRGDHPPAAAQPLARRRLRPAQRDDLIATRPRCLSGQADRPQSCPSGHRQQVPRWSIVERMLHDLDTALRGLVEREIGEDADVEIDFDAPTKDWASHRNRADDRHLPLRHPPGRRALPVRRGRASATATASSRTAGRSRSSSASPTSSRRGRSGPRTSTACCRRCWSTFLQPRGAADRTCSAARSATSASSIPLAVALPPPQDRALSDVWSALGGELKPSLDVSLIAPLLPERFGEVGPPVHATSRCSRWSTVAGADEQPDDGTAAARCPTDRRPRPTAGDRRRPPAEPSRARSGPPLDVEPRCRSDASLAHVLGRLDVAAPAGRRRRGRPAGRRHRARRPVPRAVPQRRADRRAAAQRPGLGAPATWPAERRATVEATPTPPRRRAPSCGCARSPSASTSTTSTSSCCSRRWRPTSTTASSATTATSTTTSPAGGPASAWRSAVPGCDASSAAGRRRLEAGGRARRRRAGRGRRPRPAVPDPCPAGARPRHRPRARRRRARRRRWRSCSSTSSPTDRAGRTSRWCRAIADRDARLPPRPRGDARSSSPSTLRAAAGMPAVVVDLDRVAARADADQHPRRGGPRGPPARRRARRRSRRRRWPTPTSRRCSA